METELNGLDDRPLDLDMGIAPVPESRMPGQVGIAHVVPADISGVPVDHDDFAVIAEVELEVVGFSPGAVKGGDMDAGLLHFPQVVARQLVAADFVV